MPDDLRAFVQNTLVSLVFEPDTRSVHCRFLGDAVPDWQQFSLHTTQTASVEAEAEAAADGSVGAAAKL